MAEEGEVERLKRRVRQLEMALTPFAHPDLCLFHYGLPYDALVLSQGEARLKLYHFRRAMMVLQAEM